MVVSSLFLFTAVMWAKPDAAALTSPLKGGCSPAVKPGSMRVSKKLEDTPPERSPKVRGRERTSMVSIAKMKSMNVLLADALKKLRHKFPAAATQGGHQTPWPTLEKILQLAPCGAT